MKLIYLEFDTRVYSIGENNQVDKSKYKDYIVRLTFDKLDSINIDENLQVCTSETIRGKNKTFNAYLKPKAFSISGQFSDRQSTNVEIIEQQTDEETEEMKNLLTINTLTGRDKSKRLNDLFESLVEDTRLINLKLFYGNYENYVINDFSLSYTDNSVITVELKLQEILIRDLNQFDLLSYQVTEILNKNNFLKMQYIIDNLTTIKYSDYYIKEGVIKNKDIEDYLDTYSQGGHYGE